MCSLSLLKSESYYIIVLAAHGNFFVQSFAERVLLSEHDNRSGKKQGKLKAISTTDLKNFCCLS